MPLFMRTDSTEYITATLTTDHVISAASVDVALPPVDVAPTDWYPAEVEAIDQVGSLWVVTYRILLGPAGATALEPGDYDWTVRIVDVPEIPIRKTGVLTITPT